jgi:hypothetical protein
MEITVTRPEAIAEVRERILYELNATDTASTQKLGREHRNRADGMALALALLLDHPQIAALDDGSIANTRLPIGDRATASERLAERTILGGRMRRAAKAKASPPPYCANCGGDSYTSEEPICPACNGTGKGQP